jgi:hypothetical protein
MKRITIVLNSTVVAYNYCQLISALLRYMKILLFHVVHRNFPNTIVSRCAIYFLLHVLFGIIIHVSVFPLHIPLAQ